jgi:malate dehydrogenase
MMHTVAVVGAGELGATLARRLAEADQARRVILLDGDEGRARGKALDILQAGPVEGFDAWVEGAAATAVPAADAVVIADPAELEAGRLPSDAAALLERVLPALAAGGPLVVAGGHPGVLEQAVKKGLPRERVVGSAPIALAAAVRRHAANEAQGRPSDVALTVLGRPPADLVTPRDGATLGGLPLDRVSASALRRALGAVRGRWPGPVALATAAARALAVLDAADPVVLPVLAVLAGEYGHRGRAVAVPARLGRGRILAVVEVDLAPVDRVAFDNAAGRP